MKILPDVYSVVETIHVSDIDQLGYFTPSKIGSGIAPINKAFSFLRNKGFSGWLCIEEAINQRITGIVEAFEFVRKQWESA
ncbi:MAG: hypothetical protein SCM11_03345 [Bacillota bacterium]|nr:hypothetical protein [Bacillota bacterium]